MAALSQVVTNDVAAVSAKSAHLEQSTIKKEPAEEFFEPVEILRACTGESTETPQEEISKLASTGGSAATKWNADSLTKYTKDSFVYVYEKVGNSVIVVKVKIGSEKNMPLPLLGLVKDMNRPMPWSCKAMGRCEWSPIGTLMQPKGAH